MKTHALLAIIVLAACKTPAAAEKPPATDAPAAAERPPAAEKPPAAAAEKAPAIDQAAVVSALAQKFGEPARARAERGVRQVAAYWRAEDGGAAALEGLAVQGFAAGPRAPLQPIFAAPGEDDGAHD